MNWRTIACWNTPCIFYILLYLFLQVWRFPSRQMSQVVSVDPIKPFSIRGDKVVASTRKCKNLKLISPQLCDIASCLIRNCIGVEDFLSLTNQLFWTLFVPFSKELWSFVWGWGWVEVKLVGWATWSVGGWLGRKSHLTGILSRKYPPLNSPKFATLSQKTTFYRASHQGYHSRSVTVWSKSCAKNTND